MRSDNSNFAELNRDQQREPSFVVEISFDTANTDLLYLTFDTVSGLSGANVVDGVLESISGTTQKINPDKAISTIGSLSFSAADNTLTATQKTKLSGGDGLRGKRVRYYVGAQSLVWSDFVLAQTQMVESVEYKDNLYTFRCADIQRQMREDIFDVKKTALNNHLAKDDTTVTVFNTTGFEIVKHPSTVAHEADAPGQEVGYIKIENNGEIEIIRYTGKTATTFTGCTRGVLGTKPIEINLPVDEFDAITSNADNAPKVEEYVYLELPAPMLAYALLTGSIYGETGKTLPSHWHLGISTDYVKTSDFTGIGRDWWDTTNADNGVVAVVKGQKKTDGKKFIEEQIYRMLGAFSPVYSTGELGLKRLSVVHSTGNYVRALDEDNIVKYGPLTHDMKAVINRIVIAWNWSEVREAYTRTNALIDSDSIAAHGEADPLKLELRCLEGSRHSFTTLKERFDSLRDRYAGPPLRLQLTLSPDNNDLEVGDVVRVTLANVKDYTGTTGDDTLDRNFEIQQINTDWVTGDVKVTLFGSSQKAGALTATDTGGSEGTALDTAFFTATGEKLYLLGQANDKIYQYDLSTPGDLSTGSYSTASSAFTPNYPRGGYFKQDGSFYYFVDNSNGTAYQYQLTAPFDLSTIVERETFDLSAQDGGVQALTFKPDGSVFYVVGNFNDKVYKYDVSAPWKISTASYSGTSFSIVTESTASTAINFSPDGLSMYISSISADKIFQYSLSTPWDISTASLYGSFDISPQATDAYGFTFREDGKTFYLSNNSTDTIYQYGLTTGWDITTASYASKSLSVSAQDVTPTGLHLKPASIEINATNFPGNVTSSAGVTHITGNITLEGNEDLTSPGAIFSCNEDLTIDTGVTVTIKNNVQLRVNGFLQINGNIDGKGQGLTTGDAYFGYSISQPGVSLQDVTLSDVCYVILKNGESTDVRASNRVMSAPPLTLSVNGSSVDGIPSDISGTPGKNGAAIVDLDKAGASIPSDVAAGGTGGAGGAGLMVFCEGADFGASGYVDTSGADGGAGGTYTNWSRTFHGGRGGGGAPGAVYFVFTQETPTNFPDLTSSTIIANYGSSDASGYTTLVYPKDYDRTPTVGDLPTGDLSFYRPSRAGGTLAREPHPDHTQNLHGAMSRYLYAVGFVDEVIDIPEKADDVVSFTLTEYINTPPSQQGNISTIEVSVTAPSDPNYSYAFIQYKNALNSPWLDAGPASPEGTWQVPSDGETYYVRALSVSKTGVMSATGPQDQITVADVINDPDIEGPNVMTFDAITISCESGGSTFTGKDAKFYWTDTNKDKLHFLEYKVEIKDGSTNLMRTERTKDAFYVYSYEKNKEDYEAFNLTAGANRSITIHVTVVGALDVTGGKYEGPTNSLSVSNPAPAAVGSLTVSPGYGVIYVTGTNPTDLDFTRFGIYIDTTAAFTAGPTNFLGYADHLPITIASDANGNELTSGSTYYIRIESNDEFGVGSITTDYSALMAGVPAATEIPVAETLTVNGRIIADASGDPYSVTMGPQTVDSRAALFNFRNTTTGTHYFALFEDGTVEVNGKITIGSGSTVPYAYVTSGPPSNADNTASNTAADTTLVNGVAASTVSTGAQRANSGLNSSGQVTQIIKGVNLPSTGMSTGLNLTSTYMGYYNGSSWGSYIQSNGNFHFGGSGSNYVEWNGSTLTVRGDVQATSVASSISISSPTITGGTLQTSTSGKRVVISSDTITFYDSGGASSMTLDNASTSRGFIDIQGGANEWGVSANCYIGFYGKTNISNSAACGVYGYSIGTTSDAVKAAASSGDGVSAISSSGNAVKGGSTSGTGGNFTGAVYGVRGVNTSGTNRAGGYFTGASSNVGVAGDSTSGRGVQGVSSSGYGGWFETSTGAHDVFLGGTGTAGSFTGAHDCIIDKTVTQPVEGDIVLITSTVYKNGVSNTMPEVVLANTAESKKAFGIFTSSRDLPDYDGSLPQPIELPALRQLTETEYSAIQASHKRASANGLGEGQINVCDDNGNLEIGDFICTSATPGKGQLYTGSDMRVVVAKAMEAVDWSQETESTKMIACIYMCS